MANIFLGAIHPNVIKKTAPDYVAVKKEEFWGMFIVSSGAE